MQAAIEEPVAEVADAAEAAEDEPGRSALVEVADANRVNFRIDRDALRVMVREMARTVRR